MTDINVTIPEMIISDDIHNIELKIERVEFKIIDWLKSDTNQKWECFLNNFDGIGAGDTPYEALGNAIENILENKKDQKELGYV